MGLKIRLRKQGRTNRPFYRLIVTDCRTKRDGKYVETLGWYNPLEVKEEENMSLKADRIEHWLTVGAELSEKAEALVGRAAPEVLRRYQKQKLAKFAKITEKKRLLRNKKKEAAKAS